jgi:hypothetical protein
MPERGSRRTALCEVLGRLAESSAGEFAKRSADRRPVPARGVSQHWKRKKKGTTMTKETEPVTGVRTLSPQDRTDFVRTQQALHEQLSRTQATPAQQVRMRLLLWIVRTGLETNRADFDLLDRLCQHEGGESA